MTGELDMGKDIVAEATMHLLRNAVEGPAMLRIKADDRDYAIRVLHDGLVEMGTIDMMGN